MIRVSEKQVEAILWLSSGDNAGAWSEIEKLIDERLDKAREELEKNSDINYLMRTQGSVSALRELTDLRKRAVEILEKKRS